LHCFVSDFGEYISAAGEQGKVDESMREMAAIEALKSEKSDKEVGTFYFYLHWF
jgi:hypothetical protein